jgi:hypothetical protein
MTLTVHLPAELAAALEAEPARRGRSADQVAAELLAERLPQPGARRRLAFAAVGSSASGRSAADADDMLEHLWAPVRQDRTAILDALNQAVSRLHAYETDEPHRRGATDAVA